MPEAPAAPTPTAAPSAALRPARGTVLGFDFGLARIGVATGELETRSASPLCVLQGERNDEKFAAIGQLITEWRPVTLVVGLPTHLDGREHALTVRCRRFANQLHGRFGLPVALVDERLTSVEAEARLRESSTRKPLKQAVDAVAAQILLQNFLDEPNHADS